MQELLTLRITSEEKLEHTECEIWSRKSSEDGQHNGQKDKMTNNGGHITTQQS
jgi:hypothetical protein